MTMHYPWMMGFYTKHFQPTNIHLIELSKVKFKEVICIPKWAKLSMTWLITSYSGSEWRDRPHLISHQGWVRWSWVKRAVFSKRKAHVFIIVINASDIIYLKLYLCTYVCKYIGAVPWKCHEVIHMVNSKARAHLLACW